ncbi:MAG: addiction module protein [Deltaproteobacteria bacterium]|nr:addiction module protein [Deltaproteobacteria bacterium]
MAMAARDLFSKALALPAKERARLASELIASLDEGAPDPGAAEAWDREIERRVEGLSNGTVKAVPWEEARKRIRGRLSKARPRMRCTR